ncbi:hypothetical protein L207DRAFT_507025 [Hyaloscypha variabilis F]|uniref:Uncharacterized protein n=1 Tax=Hyaloscypha variabilis (strain UAMH 11265 / GT02V1 / F) TaxID=1149755 RepID=A0A2J6S5P5_HYAVF|nr:hypothetical protein L207DRAFT_507025 [Hyaloscypha variabilis F]
MLEKRREDHALYTILSPPSPPLLPASSIHSHSNKHKHIHSHNPIPSPPTLPPFHTNTPTILLSLSRVSPASPIETSSPSPSPSPTLQLKPTMTDPECTLSLVPSNNATIVQPLIAIVRTSLHNSTFTPEHRK